MRGKRCRIRRSCCRHRKQRHSRSSQTEAQFPTGCMGHLLQEGLYAQRLSSSTPSFLAAILEHLTAYILELAGNEARNNRKRYITPQHVDMALVNNRQLGNLLSSVTLSQVKMP
nr:histone H2A-beta, sperm-like [Dasypus novemcinctus]